MITKSAPKKILKKISASLNPEDDINFHWK